MNTFIRFLITVWLLLGFISCNSHEGNKKILIQKLRLKVPITYLPGELDTLYQPLSRDSFILQEKHDEFRHPVEQQFPMKQRLAHDTWILEFTWREKADSLITVWYIREADTLKRLRYFRYSEFDIF
ncbi:hypothetical protein [Prevotella sp.]